jgi:predicted metal-binding protein
MPPHAMRETRKIINEYRRFLNLYLRSHQHASDKHFSALKTAMMRKNILTREDFLRAINRA